MLVLQGGGAVIPQLYERNLVGAETRLLLLLLRLRLLLLLKGSRHKQGAACLPWGCPGPHAPRTSLPKVRAARLDS
jgi:hypothetical protein